MWLKKLSVVILENCVLLRVDVLWENLAFPWLD